ncbi:MAG: hypothetical protein ACLGSA_10050 [Acidobacteriota bacterium]
MNTLRSILDSPYAELAVGLVLLASGILEIRDVILVRMPNTGSMMPHAAATLGAALVLRSLPGMFLGLEIADKALQGVTLRPALGLLDRMAHSHAADLTMGVILMGAGAADLVDIALAGRVAPAVGSAAGAVAFGLVPALNALLALYKGAKRVDREGAVLPKALALPFWLDRAVKNSGVQAAAGALMLCGGAWEIWEAAHAHPAAPYGAGLSGGLAVLGLYGLLSGLPGMYEGFRALSAPGEDQRR